jgi:hypothetical protein
LPARRAGSEHRRSNSPPRAWMGFSSPLITTAAALAAAVV